MSSLELPELLEESSELEEPDESEEVDDIFASASSTFKLRPYQEECVQACLDALAGGLGRIGVSSPTGSGKTAMFTALIDRLPKLIVPGTDVLAHRVMIIVGSVELATQAAATVRRTWPDLSVEIEQGRSVASGTADVTVATFQTLARSDMSRMDKFDTRMFKAVIVDEAHHASAKSYIKILERFDSRISDAQIDLSELEAPINATPIAPASSAVSDADEPPIRVSEVVARLDEAGEVCSPVLGFTATFSRADGLALGKIFEKIVWHSGWMQMITGGWLSQLRFTTVQLGQKLDLAKVVTMSTGDFSGPKLAAVVNTPEVTASVLQAYLDKAVGRRSTLVFAVNVAHIIELTNAFRAEGIDARNVHSGTPTELREATLGAFRRREFPVLVNCGILTEGADFPAIDCVLLARPTKSQNLFIQMIGRGLRLSPDTQKVDCLIIDLVGNHTRGIICTPTLFGIDPSYVIDSKSTDELRAVADKAAELEYTVPKPVVEQDVHSQSYTEFATVFDLIAGMEANKKSTNASNSINSFTPFAWVGTGLNKFVLSVPGGIHFKIAPMEPEEGEVEPAQPIYRAVLNRSFTTGVSPPRLTVTKQIALHADLRVLFQVTDAYIKHSSEFDAFNLRRDAPWRAGAASDAQKLFITRKLFPGVIFTDGVGEDGQLAELDGVWVGRPWREKYPIAELTKGRGGDIISRIMHGTLTYWKKRKAMLERGDVKLEKARLKMVANQAKLEDKEKQRKNLFISM